MINIAFIGVAAQLNFLTINIIPKVAHQRPSEESGFHSN